MTIKQLIEKEIEYIECILKDVDRNIKLYYKGKLDALKEILSYYN